MNLKDNYFVIAVVIVAIIALAGVGLAGNSGDSANYINVTDDGKIKFDAHGYEVSEINVEEEVYTGQFDNKTFYVLTDGFGREVEICIYHTSMDSPNSTGLISQNSNGSVEKAMWVGNYSGNYYSVVVDEPANDSCFNSKWVNERIIIIE